MLFRILYSKPLFDSTEIRPMSSDVKADALIIRLPFDTLYSGDKMFAHHPYFGGF